MRPVEFPEANTVFAKDQPEYHPLPACFVDDRVITCWKLTFWDRFKMLFTGKLWLQQLTFGDPLQPQLPQTSCPLSTTGE